MLTHSQQDIAERALEFVQPCLAYFMSSYPCLRAVVDRDELESAARLACVMAARTFDPTRDMRAYFSRAILHELLKSCRSEIRSQSGSVYRVELTTIERRLPPEKLEANDHLPSDMLTALHSMSADDQQWIVTHVIEGVSIRQMARDKGISSRQATKLMAAKLSRLRKSLSSENFDASCPT